MECFNCKDKLTNNIISCDTSKYGLEINNKYYCNGCYDAIDLLGENREIKEIKEIKENLNKKSLEKKSEVIYNCVGCRKSTSGNNCSYCGKLSPLFRKKK
jgi:hypothetical protein